MKTLPIALLAAFSLASFTVFAQEKLCEFQFKNNTPNVLILYDGSQKISVINPRSTTSIKTCVNPSNLKAHVFLQKENEVGTMGIRIQPGVSATAMKVVNFPEDFVALDCCGQGNPGEKKPYKIKCKWSGCHCSHHHPCNK